MHKTNPLADTKFDQYSIRAIAIFEGIKGALMLGLVLSFITIFRSSPETVTEVLIDNLHLNANSHYPQVLLMLSKTFTGMQIHLAVTCAFLYAAIKISEAYGLWFYHHWGRMLGVLSIGVLIPYEGYEVLRQYSHFKLFILILNVAIVGFLLFRFNHKSKASNGLAAIDDQM